MMKICSPGPCLQLRLTVDNYETKLGRYWVGLEGKVDLAELVGLVGPQVLATRGSRSG